MRLVTVDSRKRFPQEIEEAPATVRSFLIKKHTLNTNMLKFLFRQKLQEAGRNFKDPCFRKMVLSLFLGNHESHAWPQELYLTTTLSDTLEIFCRNILETSQQFQLDTFEEEYKEDVAGTCVFDGKSYLSQDELFKRLRQHDLQIPEVHYCALKDVPGEFTLTKKTPYKIKYSANVDNKDLLSDFNTHSHIFVSESYVDTLYYRMRNAQGDHALLRYAGLKGLKTVTVENLLAGRRIEDLSIDDMKTSSAEAITYLHALAHSAIEVINAFQAQALTLIATPDADFLHINAAKLSKELEQLEDIASVNTA